MSQGPIKQFIDYSTGSGGDTGQNNTASLLPYQNGEDVIDTVVNRPIENIRQRTEAVRSVEEDTLYLRDADRALTLAGPGLVSWPGSTTNSQSGILSLSDVLYLVPMLTPGAAQASPVPPVASKYGTLVLAETGVNQGIVVSSLRRDYAGGSKINITVVAGGAPGTVTAQLFDTPGRTIVLTA